MAIRSEQGIVLRSYPFGEADRVVVLLSPNRGKMRTVAKGVRKTKSRFGGRLEPFTHIDVVVYEGRALDTITQVSVIDPFAHLRLDLERVMAAGTMVEGSTPSRRRDRTRIGCSCSCSVVCERSIRAGAAGIWSAPSCSNSPGWSESSPP